MKNKFKVLVFFTTILSLFAIGKLVLASVYEGTLSTGLTANTGDVVNGVVIGPPTANPPAGTYTSSQSVVLTSSGAMNIHYSIDGSEPTCVTSATSIPYVLPIPVDVSMTIKALSCYPNGISSVVADFGYIINSPTPTPTPEHQSSGGGGGGGSYYSGTPTPSPQILGITVLKGDMNNDSKVDIIDFNTLMINWGKTGSGIAADLNGNGTVDIFDFNILMVNWTK